MEVQTTLHGALPGLRPIPCESLHISLYGVIPVGWESPVKEAYWRQASADVLGILHLSCEAAPTFALTFDRLRVDAFAVIALAAEWPPVVDQLRKMLGAAASSAGIPAPSYSIVHCTLARFSHATEISAAVVAQVEQHPLHAVVAVEGARLVRERVYPSLVFDVLEDFRLRD